MPSQLYDNEAVTFICGRDFLYNGKQYKTGKDFPQEDLLDSPEVLVRNRFIIPVIDEMIDKPRHWHREVKLKSIVLKKLKQDVKDKSREPEEEPEDESFDPNEHTVPDVREYLENADEDEQLRVLLLEENGKARKGVLEDD